MLLTEERRQRSTTCGNNANIFGCFCSVSSNLQLQLQSKCQDVIVTVSSTFINFLFQQTFSNRHIYLLLSDLKKIFSVYSLELLKKRIELGFEDPFFKSGKRGFNYTYFSTQTRAGNVSAKHVILFIYITTGKRG